jgi:putative effector of murein hydrolase
MTGSTTLGALLSIMPLFWLTATVCAWIVAGRIARASGFHPLANPVLISIAAIALLLTATGTTFEKYSADTQVIQVLIAPAVVAIAVPLFRNWQLVKANAFPIVAAIMLGCVTAVLSVLALSRAFGLPGRVAVSLAPKSATAGAAMSISHSVGGDVVMTAAFTVATSIIGAVALVSIMRLLRVRDETTIGFSAGLCAHAVGTARAFQIGPVAGTFAGIALCLNAVLTALIVPLLTRLFGVP